MVRVPICNGLFPFALGNQRFEIGRLTQINRGTDTLPRTHLIFGELPNGQAFDCASKLNGLFSQFLVALPLVPVAIDQGQQASESDEATDQRKVIRQCFASDCHTTTHRRRLGELVHHVEESLPLAVVAVGKPRPVEHYTAAAPYLLKLFVSEVFVGGWCAAHSPHSGRLRFPPQRDVVNAWAREGSEVAWCFGSRWNSPEPACCHFVDVAKAQDAAQALELVGYLGVWLP